LILSRVSRQYWWATAVLVGAGAMSALVPWFTVCAVVFLGAFLLVTWRPLQGFLLLVMLQPFLDRVVEIPLGKGLPDLSFGRLTLAFLVISILGREVLDRTRRMSFGIMEACILAVPVGIMLAAPLSTTPWSVIQISVDFFLAPLLMYFVAKNTVEDAADLERLFRAVMVFGLLATAYMVFELSTGIILFLEEGVDPEHLSRVYSRTFPSLWLVRGLLASSASFGRVFVTTIPVTIYLYFRQADRTRRWLLVSAVLFQCFGLFLSLNRSCWVAFVFGLAILQFAFPRLRVWVLTVVALGLVALIPYWRQAAESSLVRHRLLYNIGTLNNRLPRWQTGFEMWKAEPWRGWGFGQFPTHSGRFRRDGGTGNLEGTENDFLLIMVGAGLLGFLPYLVSLLAPCVWTVRLLPQTRAPDWRGFTGFREFTVYWAVLASLLLTSMTVIQTQPVVRALVYAIAGAIVGTHERWLPARLWGARKP
jgi:O-antigen ligase